MAVIDRSTDLSQPLDKLGPDARSDAQAGAVHSTNESASAVYWNPAGLAALRHRDATMSHTAYFQNVFYDFVGYAQPIESYRI